ncbi:MAG TPA: sigma-70 family RNA polymerase sigma factor [Oscillospiraceae bacterium]|nr:sigma-70 family RNA polymerase sigma factor [Oscillospiraceae bacterium]HPF55906.1 sigma-70 family RNA polymerase sigma factor [Clostridiales bacterium]HPK35238.1 sigma-70 family RNA polymerase sigma factor [Oscillospiraceae bacterium]HPR75431.1 sigma-70 family RNA polymerase sigma factor [Oscillospiraceae bacterium]
MTREEQLRKITEQYLSAFLGFAVNKIGNISEAEELAQEITFQAVAAVNRGNINENFDSYIWSIAHNTFKRWCKRKTPLPLDDDMDTFTNIMSDTVPAVEQIISDEETNEIRLALSRLTKDYRQTLVCFYYDELSIRETAKRLLLSEEMVKFYLRAGKQKLKEAFDMNQIGEKSYNPLEFSVYKSGLDLSKVNIWEVFKRKLPCQIAIICHDSAKTVGEISIGTGTPSVYIEDEIGLLLDAGVMTNPVKGKYRTNFHILKENAVYQIRKQFERLYESYVSLVLKAYEKYKSELLKCGVFKFDATPNQWAWYFIRNIPAFAYEGYELTADDYPRILSCGSKSIIFAEAAKGSVWAMGETPTFLEKCDVHPCDVLAFGKFHRQNELRDKRKAQALYDVFCGDVKETDKEIYAELIEQGYVIKRGEKLFCNVAVTTKASRELFHRINVELSSELKKLCGDIRANISRIVSATLPEQLKAYENGYTETWIAFYAGIYFNETLYQRGFIQIPERNDLTPIACLIYEK